MLSLKKLSIIIILILLVLGSVIIVFTKNKSQKPILPVSYKTKSDDQGGVIIEVTPEKLGINEPQNIFEVKLNTHSVDLAFDFTKVMVLVDDLDNSYPALKWEGGQGGHHLTGKVIFPKLKTGVQKVILKMTQIGGMERSFSWDLTAKINGK